MKRDDLLTTISAVRQDTLGLFKELAKYTDAEKHGWRPREPGTVDVTMALVKTAIEAAPLEAASLLALIADNDERVAILTRELVHDLR